MNNNEKSADSLVAYKVVGVRVDATSYEDATRRVVNWASNCESRYVCVANVHQVMEAVDSEEFRRIVEQADLVTPDGMPLVWMLRRLGNSQQTRVYGPELMLSVCEAAQANAVPVALFGGSPDTIEKLKRNLATRFPALEVCYSHSPPFRPMTEDETVRFQADISASGARILFVGLGCPKQERWMAGQRNRLPCVMLGVGAAFDFHAGTVKQAPNWMQSAGLEWLFRMLAEPRRLWRRYVQTIPRFLWLAARQLLQR